MLRVDDRKGRIAAGYDADIIVLSDDYEVKQTYCLGKAML
jgi:N-acetylglucosamine-6-phosphate deacetylase